MAQGRYGTNRGDIWLKPDCKIQRMLDEKGEGMVLIHEVLEISGCGQLAERRYVTSDRKLIALAMAGYERYVAARAELGAAASPS
jgi:hypothetical protein